MSLKKSLRTGQARIGQVRTGQASLEYFILLSVIGILTIIAGSSFLAQTRQSAQNLYSTAAGRIKR